MKLCVLFYFKTIGYATESLAFLVWASFTPSFGLDKLFKKLILLASLFLFLTKQKLVVIVERWPSG